ncbi:hypothetical protein GCM10008106_31610 [Mongoliitalea lutea]|uniref:Uncharacterized protein n=2 Tax=Mongoliitalea lutea TaxID=849756 RepID=A0A8J3D0L1_9BACT|nr:hypothetical protein GCM10008106_31610 [Mongoliitalea lutea]
MNFSNKYFKFYFIGCIITILFLEPTQNFAQRMNHPSTGRASGAAASRGAPTNMNRGGAPTRPAAAPSRPSAPPTNRGAMQPGRNPSTQGANRPSNPGMSPSRPSQGSITGGAQRQQDRRPSAQPGRQDRSISDNRQQRDRAAIDRGNLDRGNATRNDRNTVDRGNTGNRGDRNTSGNRNETVGNRGDRNTTGNRDRNPNNNINNRPSRPGGGNNINIGNNNQININAQRNTFVRVNVMHPMMMRPPFMWGGFRIYSMHAFFWFPFRPMFWGPMWHPWGFHTPMLPPQAQVVNVVNETNIINETNITNITNVTNVINEYHYVDGVFYQRDDEGYVVVPAPIGAEVRSIPDNFEKVAVADNEYNLYWGGAYFEETPNGFRVVPPTAGTLVENLSEGGEEVKIGDKTFIRFGETYYLPVQVNGRNMYEVVYVESEENTEDS